MRDGVGVHIGSYFTAWGSAVLCSVLNDDQIRRIHECSVRVLEDVGVVVPHEDMLRRLSDAGARVDWDTERAYIPEDMVAASLDSAGKQFTIFGRDRSRTAAFGYGERNYNSIAGEAAWIDCPGGERRPAMLADTVTAARFGDALDTITVVGAMADAQDVPPVARPAAMLAALVRNTTKPVHFWFHDRASAKYVVEMLVVLQGDEDRAARYPLCYPFLEPISPLRFPADGIDVLYETARLGLPVPVGPMAQMGVSAPATIAGTLVQENAEILAGICVVQLVRSGLPVCYGGICHAFDMATTQLVFGGPEQAIFGVAMTQMGKHYGLPVYINAGLSDSKRPDAQAGLEAGITLALGAAAGADIFGHMGIAGVDQAASLDTLVLQDELIAYVESTNRSIDFSDTALGLDRIEQAGPGGGHIGSDHTLRHFRRELWFPSLLDRRYYDAWRDDGAKDMAERCRFRKEDILGSHEPVMIEPEVDRELSTIVQAATKDGYEIGR
jgi:trimethylamine---corrinoid protein Co-methyltransferase